MRRSAVVVMSLFAIAGGLPLAAKASDREICFAQNRAHTDARIAACRRLIASGTLSRTRVEQVQRYVAEVEKLARLKASRVAVLGAYIFRNHLRERVCKPVMRDVFTGRARDNEDLEGAMITQCEDCFVDGLNTNFSGAELVILDDDFKGESADVEVKAIEEVQKKYADLFRSCSSKLVERLGEELSSRAAKRP